MLDQKKLNMTTPLILFNSLLEGTVDKLWNQSLLEYLSACGMCSTSPDLTRSFNQWEDNIMKIRYVVESK